ncbi:MAG: hypothetical protein IKY94_13530 [Lachnospiraceae bacterium]|nr:hypothetical protein [Lachnospiraceae bacterium]
MRKKDAYKVLFIAMAAVLWGNNPLRVDATESETQYEILEESKQGQMESVYIDENGSTVTNPQDDKEREKEMVEEGEPEEVPENTYGDHTIPGLEDYQEATKTDTLDAYGEATLETEGAGGWNGDEFDYTGPLDERTGKPLTTTVTNDGGGVYIMGKDDYNFDSKTGRYEILCGDMSVGFDVPPESLLSYGEKFNMYVPMGVTVTIYYNGELLENQNTTQFSKAGTYTFQIETPYASDGKRTVNVNILKKKVNNINRIILPDGFEFSKVKVDGEETTLSSKNVYECYREGKYEVSWECTEVGESFYTTFELDTTAPTLALPEVIDGQAKKPVTLEDMSGDTYVVYEANGERVVITDNTKTITLPGDYVLLACDEAGNYTRYEFTLHTYLNSGALSAILLVVAGIVTLISYCRRLRHHMRVG